VSFKCGTRIHRESKESTTELTYRDFREIFLPDRVVEEEETLVGDVRRFSGAMERLEKSSDNEIDNLK